MIPKNHIIQKKYFEKPISFFESDHPYKCIQKKHDSPKRKENFFLESMIAANVNVYPEKHNSKNTLIIYKKISFLRKRSHFLKVIISTNIYGDSKKT